MWGKTLFQFQLSRRSPWYSLLLLLSACQLVSISSPPKVEPTHTPAPKDERWRNDTLLTSLKSGAGYEGMSDSKQTPSSTQKAASAH